VPWPLTVVIGQVVIHRHSQYFQSSLLMFALEKHEKNWSLESDLRCSSEAGSGQEEGKESTQAAGQDDRIGGQVL